MDKLFTMIAYAIVSYTRTNVQIMEYIIRVYKNVGAGRFCL